jgi:ribosomal protein S18 acetylase RimI-like enzyme
VNEIPLFTRSEQDIAIELIDASITEPEDGYRTLVATRNSNVLGFISFGDVPLTRKVFEIYWIGVSPRARRCGIGRKLINACKRALKKETARLLLLETSSQERYGGTRDFYHACGFTVESEIKDYYKPNDDLVVFGFRF